MAKKYEKTTSFWAFLYVFSPIILYFSQLIVKKYC